MEFCMQTVQKILARGGQKFSWGGTQNLFDGGAGFNREVLPLDGGGGSPNPPHIGQPWLKKLSVALLYMKRYTVHGYWGL